MLPRLTLGAIILALAGHYETGAQGEPQVPQFRGRVDLVQLDAVVLDRNRRPVTDLSADDFTILEDGLPQAITAFQWISIPAGQAAAGEQQPGSLSDVYNNRVGDGRLVVLYMDDRVHGFGQARQAYFDVGRAIVEHLGPEDQAAVVFASDRPEAQEFTNDKGRLLAAVKAFGTGTYSPARPSLGKLAQVARTLEGIEGRRKLIVYVGVGVPFDPAALAPALGVFGDPVGKALDMMWELQEVLRAAERSNVSIYTFDPRGLSAPTRDNYDPDPHSRDSLRILAAETGGRAFVNVNGPSVYVPRVFAENAAYYLLGFSSTRPEADGRFRRLKVEVNRPGVSVQARSGYYALPAAMPDPEWMAPYAEVRRALTGLLATADLPMVLAAAPFANPQGNGAKLLLTTSLEAPIPEREATTETVDLDAAVFDTNGRSRSSEGRNVQLRLRPTPDDVVRYQVLSVLDAKPGHHHVRVSAHARERDRTGSVFTDVEVPDFDRDRISLSGLLFTTEPARPSFPRDRLAEIVPVIPTTRRAFSTSDRVGAFLRVYQGGRRQPQPATMASRIEDAAGNVVWNESETLHGGGAAVDYGLTLPLAALSTGAYVLLVEARLEDGATASCSVPFRVR